MKSYAICLYLAYFTYNKNIMLLMIILKLSKGLVLFAKIKKLHQIKMLTTLQLQGYYHMGLYYSKQMWLFK